jgi:hypothetical protein
MCEVDIATAGKSRVDILAELKHRFSELDPESVVRIRPDDVAGLPAAAELRSVAPGTMNLVMSNTYRRNTDEYHA